MHLETERLILRNAQPSDAEAYYQMWNSPYDLRYNCMNPPTRETAAHRVQRDAGSDAVIYIERKADGAMIGTIDLDEDALRYQVSSYTLAYALAEPYAGQGYMTEALRRVLSYLFEDLGADVVSARSFDQNAASLRLLERLGFVREGMLRRAVRAYDGTVYDDVLFSLLREEYDCLRHA